MAVGATIYALGYLAFLAFLWWKAKMRSRGDVYFAIFFALMWPIVGLPFIIAGLIP